MSLGQFIDGWGNIVIMQRFKTYFVLNVLPAVEITALFR